MSLKSKKQSVKKAPYEPHLTSLYLEKDDTTFARLYLVITKQAFVYKEAIKEVQGESLWMYETTSQLWIQIGLKHFRTLYTNTMEEFFTNQMKLLLDDKKLASREQEEKLKKLMTFRKHVKNALMAKQHIEMLVPLLKQYDAAGLELDMSKVLDTNRHVMNFKNGLVCLKTGEFRPRVKEDYCSMCLPYDYHKDEDKVVHTDIKRIIKEICNDDDNHTDSILNWFGYCLTGCVDAQKYMYFIGQGGNGKSKLLEFYQQCFDVYHSVGILQTFQKSYTMFHKAISGLTKKRVAVFGEQNEQTQDYERLKTATGDAQITYEVLFKTTATVDITAKINFLANTNPNYQNIDGGIRRRLLVSLHKNRWLEQDEIDRRRAKGEDVSNIKVPDPKLLHKFDEESYKLAYFQILLPHAIAYYQKGLVICASMREETNNLVEDNDTMGEFLENCVEKTNNDDDKIGKDDFYMRYKLDVDIKAVWSSVLSHAQRSGLVYSRSKTVGNRKGVFVGCRWKDNTIENEEIDKVVESKPKNESVDAKSKTVKKKKAVATINPLDEGINPLDEGIENKVFHDLTF